MADTVTKLPVDTRETTPETTSVPQIWRPFESLRREVDRLFENFDQGFLWSPFQRTGFDFTPFWQQEIGFGATPAVDIVETDDAYEVSAELPGIDEKNIEVSLVDGSLTIKGEKEERSDEEKKGYYLHERHFGSFERRFRIPESVDPDRIEARFRKGVLTVTLPKKPEARKPAKKIEVKAA